MGKVNFTESSRHLGLDEFLLELLPFVSIDFWEDPIGTENPRVTVGPLVSDEDFKLVLKFTRSWCEQTGNDVDLHRTSCMTVFPEFYDED